MIRIVASPDSTPVPVGMRIMIRVVASPDPAPVPVGMRIMIRIWRMCLKLLGSDS